MATIIEGIVPLQQKLKYLEAKAIRECSKSVIVGYTANYALYVHENVEMKGQGKPRRSRFGKKGRGFYWDPQGIAQAKFLEAPARKNKDEYGRIAVTIYKRTRKMDAALLGAGLRLQRDSQKLVPVDIGNLKASAFTRFDV